MGQKVNLQFLHDLQFNFPDLKELLASNLKYCLQFFQFYCGPGTKIISMNPNIISFSQQSVDQIHWKPYRANKEANDARRIQKNSERVSPV